MSRPRNMPAKSFLRENSLTILTIIGVCTGSVVGLILKHNSESEWSKRDIMYITFPGEIFLRYVYFFLISFCLYFQRVSRFQSANLMMNLLKRYINRRV